MFDKLKCSVELGFNKTNVIIVICGDVFHNKTKLTPEDVDLFYYFLDLFIDYTTVYILGNHDLNVNNVGRMDLLSPLITSKYINTRLIMKSQCFEIYNIKFCCLSVFNDFHIKDDEIYIDGGVIKTTDMVLLYHGAVEGTPFTTPRYEHFISRAIMDKFKICLLGDTHQYQQINSNAVYSGSLIQQNLGEDMNKGYVVWGAENATHKFIKLDNDYGMLKIDLKNIEYKEIPKYLDGVERPKNILKLSIKIPNALIQKRDDIINLCSDKFKHPVNRICYDNTNITNNGGGVVKTECISENIDMVQSEIIEMLKIKNIDKNTTDEIIEIHKKMIIGYMEGIKRKKWSIQRIEWNNILKYGNGNVIDFTNVDRSKIVGIVAGNMMGKSTVFDICIFALYGEFLRGNAKDIINWNSTSYEIKLNFIINSVDEYYIQI
jgi:DNA repair exonuclease SbcCD nuclease subunit